MFFFLKTLSYNNLHTEYKYIFYDFEINDEMKENLIIS